MVKFELILKNNTNEPWPGNGKTKLISDKDSDFDFQKDLESNLNNGIQKVIINLNVSELGVGKKRCILHFNVCDKNYGNPIILNVNIKESKAEQFRKEYQLEKSEFPDEKIIPLLKKYNNDFSRAFGSLYQ